MLKLKPQFSTLFQWLAWDLNTFFDVILLLGKDFGDSH